MCVGGSRRGWSDYNRFIENLWDCLVLISDIPTHGNKWQVVTVLHLYLHTPILVTAVQLFRKPAFFPETGIASYSAASQLWRSFTVKYSWGDLSDQNHQKHLCHHDLRHAGAEDGRGESRCQVSNHLTFEMMELPCKSHCLFYSIAIMSCAAFDLMISSWMSIKTLKQ